MVLPVFSMEIKTAGGRISCLRCTALSKRTKKQCGRPALKTSSTQKCQFHGGKSTGPKTHEGRKNIAESHFIHGNETATIRAERQKKNLWLSQAEDVIQLINMTAGARSRGPKPIGYKPITTIADALQWAISEKLHPNKGG